MQLDLFSGTVVPPAPPQPKHKKSAWEIERDELEEQRREWRGSFPKDDGALVERYRDLLRIYHAAAVEGDIDRQREAANQMDALREFLFGFDESGWKGNGRFDCLHSAGNWLAANTAAPDGDEPLFGQKGRLLLVIAGCRTDFEYDGLFGICGGSARVIDLNRPFYSETGYRSFQVCPYDHILHAGGYSPSEYLVRVCETQLGAGNKGKIKLVDPPFGFAYVGQKRADDRLRSERENDPAYLPGGYLHADQQVAA